MFFFFFTKSFENLFFGLNCSLFGLQSNAENRFKNQKLSIIRYMFFFFFFNFFLYGVYIDATLSKFWLVYLDFNVVKHLSLNEFI